MYTSSVHPAHRRPYSALKIYSVLLLHFLAYVAPSGSLLLPSSDAAVENSLVVKLFDDVQTARIGQKNIVLNNRVEIWR